ncbi:diguanylate cyclase domain-containing protein [Litoreibacter roseus]|uniref:diguanylate cyclase n=1 Tax=Litoreibacter roseus TaxID=2601869 RepID=A0A6N6JHV5_9RHOB|nr:diguanylate cyclase [Litoreibacter roseus]GFE65420.1 diguanylate cyclase response regulator [Litoreibacter roseus]
MTGTVIHLDAIATNRIVLKAMLGRAHYDVLSLEHADPESVLSLARSAEALIVDQSYDGGAGLALCAAIKRDPALRDLPVILTSPLQGTEISAAEAFSNGADDYLPRPFDDQVFLARLRNLIGARERLRHLIDHLDPVEEEAPLDDLPQGRVALLATEVALAQHHQHGLSLLLETPLRQLNASDLMMPCDGSSGYDVIVIACRLREVRSQLMLLSDLRTRSPSRDAAVIMMVHDDDGMGVPHAPLSALAVEAMGLGASDFLTPEFSVIETVARINARLAGKLREDQLRARIQTSLRDACIDPLTGLHNRRYAMTRLGQIRHQASAQGSEFAVLMLDIDHFKTINDRHGHSAGDSVLRMLARALKRNLRDTDLLARIGGEEFLIALPKTSANEARHTADRLLAITKALNYRAAVPHMAQPVTLSIGLSMSGESCETGELMARADTALYHAKSAGRDRVTESAVAA